MTTRYCESCESEYEGPESEHGCPARDGSHGRAASPSRDVAARIVLSIVRKHRFGAHTLFHSVFAALTLAGFENPLPTLMEIAADGIVSIRPAWSGRGFWVYLPEDLAEVRARRERQRRRRRNLSGRRYRLKKANARRVGQ